MSSPFVISCAVATTLAANRIVVGATGAAKRVQYRDTVTSLPIGITIDTVKDTTQSIPVQIMGAAYCLFDDTASAGALVASDTSGRGVPFALALTSTAISAPAAYAGILWDATVAATGAVAQIFIRPGFDRKSA